MIDRISLKIKTQNQNTRPNREVNPLSSMYCKNTNHSKAPLTLHLKHA